MATSEVAEQYDEFAEDYHWLYSDRALTGEPFLEPHKDLLESLDPGAAILDCSCGIGVQALALARRGYCVQASDVSTSMIAQAQQLAGKADLSVPFTTASWEDLPRKFTQRFDLAFCTGNAIGHCKGEAEMISSLRAIRAVLKDHGLLVLDSRNWEKRRAEQPRFHVLGVRTRNGQRCIPLYVWNSPANWHDPHVVEVVLIFETNGQVSYRCYPVTYHPFRVEELLDRLEQAGFVDIETDYCSTNDGYSVTARRG